MKFFVYKYTNKINGKMYIGYTCNLKQRHEKHKYDCQHFDWIFYRSIKKYSWNNFIGPEIICRCKTEKMAKKKEIYWIKKLHTYIKDILCNGYNMTKGGEGTFGLPRTEEFKNRMRIFANSRRDILKNNWLGENNPNFGKHENHPLYGKKRPDVVINFSKNWRIINPSGKVIQVYNLKNFCRENNLNSGHMSRVVNGLLSQHKGYTRMREVCH